MTFAIGDTVRTPYGEVGTIDQIADDWTGRDDQPLGYSMYHVESTQPGAPQVWWGAGSLELAPFLTEAQKAELLEVEAWKHQQREAIRRLERTVEATYRERLEVVKNKHRQEARRSLDG